jgi:predicted PhzF superfamily epimerase YddE/YHI9
VTELYVLRVFIGPDGRGGNPLGVFVDGSAVPPDRRPAVATELGFSETVFVDDPDRGEIRIFTPASELPFAGHPTVGTAWLLRELGRRADVLRPPAGEVPVRHHGNMTWVRARAAWVHSIRIEQLPTAADVDAHAGQPMGTPGLYVWAWEDEAAGRLRSRYFATDIGIVEDEATGAAAVVMGDRIGRPLTIHQGVGSEILVRPGEDETIEIGGRVGLVETREYATGE